ncbi:MAG: glutaredoxin, partial [Gaiellaceae bacterium]
AVRLGKADGAEHDRLGRERARRHRGQSRSACGGISAAKAAFSLIVPRIEVYTTAWCGYCDRAKALLQERGLAYDEIRVDHDPAFRAKLLDLTGRWTVPQILIDGRPIGGFTELRELDRSGVLAAADEPAAD